MYIDVYIKYLFYITSFCSPQNVWTLRKIIKVMVLLFLSALSFILNSAPNLVEIKNELRKIIGKAFFIVFGLEIKK